MHRSGRVVPRKSLDQIGQALVDVLKYELLHVLAAFQQLVQPLLCRTPRNVPLQRGLEGLHGREGLRRRHACFQMVSQGNGLCLALGITKWKLGITWRKLMSRHEQPTLLRGQTDAKSGIKITKLLPRTIAAIAA